MLLPKKNNIPMVEMDKLKKISIRGRVAYCICLCKAALKKEFIESILLDVVFKKIGSFCEIGTLDVWENDVSEYMPCVLLDEKLDFSTFKYISEATALELKEHYESVPKYIVEMIDNTIEVGLANLYAGTGMYSESSLICCLDVMKLCISNNVYLLPLDDYLKYSFGHKNGWGERFVVRC